MLLSIERRGIFVYGQQPGLNFGRDNFSGNNRIHLDQRQKDKFLFLGGWKIERYNLRYDSINIR